MRDQSQRSKRTALPAIRILGRVIRASMSAIRDSTVD